MTKLTFWLGSRQESQYSFCCFKAKIYLCLYNLLVSGQKYVSDYSEIILTYIWHTCMEKSHIHNIWNYNHNAKYNAFDFSPHFTNTCWDKICPLTKTQVFFNARGRVAYFHHSNMPLGRTNDWKGEVGDSEIANEKVFAPLEWVGKNGFLIWGPTIRFGLTSQFKIILACCCNYSKWG